ncbi:MAG: hypothetical protein R3C68_09185 [Myxococcota bacterium]
MSSGSPPKICTKMALLTGGVGQIACGARLPVEQPLGADELGGERPLPHFPGNDPVGHLTQTPRP